MSDDGQLSESLVSTSRKTSAWIGPGCLMLFFAVFLAAGVGVLYGLVYRTYMEYRDAQSWTEVPCTIVSSELQFHRDDDGVTYSPRIIYSYQWNGAEYTSERYQIATYSSSSRKAHQAVVDDHPPGAQTVCYVNPRKPATAVLDRSRAPGIWIGVLLGSIFSLVGGGGVIGCLYAVRAAARKRQAGAALPSQTVQPSLGLESLEAGDLLGGERRLKQKQGRLVTFLIAIGISIFWNGIVSVFVVVLVNSFMAGKPQWFMAIFLLPFVAVGLAMIFFVVYTFLTLFNAVPQITLLNQPLRLGSELAIRWGFRGGTSRIQKLTIALIGEEVATYQQGTSTATDRSKFFEAKIVETDQPHDIRSGQAMITIPANVMHSWNSSNNQIEWKIDVHGVISFYPDVRDSFQVDVHPMELWEEV